ncbi:hypothetical protein SHI21_03240 [Bacteriovorax sp. PP10]|uniref:Uncharacterized protein n=1 Tax=Bacteriovorax antarcticus TaxID=3088717 RepID=A0ABU5VQ74_9BACT|nr:hypothetical protein [Bacteriovorax sp. PP10]MEA9355195.1 hypothetical protein [Bacteriovorax sp. PP10]
MNMRTKSLYPFAGQYCPVDIFGYASNGIPGIEIVGLGKYSRSMKEKFIYLSRERKLRFPLKRFVLCIEGEVEGKKFKEEEYRYLELPLLLMLWSLTGHLPLGHLEDCFASGKISVEGEVSALLLNNQEQENLNEIFKLDDDQVLKIIAPEKTAVFSDYYHLPLEALFASLIKS